MWAHRKIYVKQWQHQKPEERYSVVVRRGGKLDRDIQPDRITNIDEELIVWRKANHIHGWFVDNVMGGEDPNDGREYRVSEEHLKELLSVCQRVAEASKLIDGQVANGYTYGKDSSERIYQWVPGKVIEDATVARDLLPVRQGFFFGGEHYDEWYLEDVIETKVWAELTLAEIARGVPGEIYYSSSW